ncbi:MAG TPA: FKBP-type peptidyl-prolyl cis-trans isomerase [Solirubrobacterales bacterium]|nr:FKBP-type peptidyl-prolyl cis-trans isomerase [Solirubrobacterales bacterium]
MRTLMLTIFACAALAVSGCGGDEGSSTDSTTAQAPAKKTKPKVTVPSGAPPAQLETKDLEEGTGAEAKAGDEVTVQYVGVTYKNGKEFDASWNRGEPYPFTLGGSEVIPGWEQGVEGMKEGGRRELIIPPELGYGERGFPPAIPPNETLVFVIDLLEVG